MANNDYVTPPKNDNKNNDYVSQPQNRNTKYVSPSKSNEQLKYTASKEKKNESSKNNQNESISGQFLKLFKMYFDAPKLPKSMVLKFYITGYLIWSIIYLCLVWSWKLTPISTKLFLTFYFM